MKHGFTDADIYASPGVMRAVKEAQTMVEAVCCGHLNLGEELLASLLLAQAVLSASVEATLPLVPPEVLSLLEALRSQSDGFKVAILKQEAKEKALLQ